MKGSQSTRKRDCSNSELRLLLVGVNAVLLPFLSG